ncbi:AGAP001083-PD [Anopheles gambiae str. PEST]|uniref:AGAP001083-PD n=2 Tax=gambiae species complex TaxID=44542 RepID=F5HM02_ANOGA|nr:AGAP001083-PD [Anopheles gambiae str. PEST]
MTPAQKNAYLEAHMAVQQQMAQAALQLQHQHHQQQLQQQHLQQQHSLSYNRAAKKTKISHDPHQLLQQGSHQSQQHQHQPGSSPSAHPNPTVSHYINTIKVPQINAGTHASASNAVINTAAPAGTVTSTTTATSSARITSTGSTSGNSIGRDGGGCSSGSSGSSTFTVPDDVGMGFEGGVRVLQSLGNWYIVLSDTARLHLTSSSLSFSFTTTCNLLVILFVER